MAYEQEELQQQDTSNEYSGFCLAQDDYKLDVVDPKATTPQQFYDRYVSPRKPCVLNGPLPDKEWRGALWTDSYLREHAGSAQMRVEHRENTQAGFGRGRERIMTLAAFLDAVEAGNTLLYLTTQELEVSADGRPDVISPPVTHLHKDFPLRPRLMGALVPQNMNLWAGHSGGGPNGSSTGLHHDYHDNIYILLRGRKRFRLWSPDTTQRMYVRGTLARVHTNGRINYEGQVTRADGADEDVEAAVAAAAAVDQAALEAEVAEAEAAVERGEADAQARLDAAEHALEAALEAVLDAECGAGAPKGASFADYPPLAEHRTSDEDESDDEAAATSDASGSDAGDASGVCKDRASNGKRKAADSNDAGTPAKRVGGTEDVPPPDNFSRVDLSLEPNELKKRFPLFVGTHGCEVLLEPGQMLYLPAGWFHEVTSYSNSKMAAPDSPGHMAFNYWYHPPDMEGVFEKPYISSFWEDDWADRTGSGHGVRGLYTER